MLRIIIEKLEHMSRASKEMGILRKNLKMLHELIYIRNTKTAEVEQ